MSKLLLVSFICLVTSFVYSQSSLDGLYIGIEEMCYIGKDGKKDCYGDPSRPKWKWYHRTQMKIKGDSVFVDQSPIAIYKKDTIYSVSDGGFYYYRGTLKKSDTLLNISLAEWYCDYCGHKVITLRDGSEQIEKRTKQWKARVTSKGLLINGYLFRRAKIQENLFSESPQPTK
jgi:hypothetical protein